MDLSTWERKTEWPLAGSAVLFAVVYAWDVLAQPTGAGAIAARVVTGLVWLVFVVDYVIRLRLAPERKRWFIQHWFDFAMVALPMFRPLRLLRLVTLFTILQRAADTALRGRVIVYAALSTVILVFLAGLAMLDAERSAPGASIVTFGNALWWAVVTMTTVGYGDYTPVTITGRLIATGMMIAGIALLGTVTATLASWLVQRIADNEEVGEAATRKQMDELTDEVRALRLLLNQTSAVLAGDRQLGTKTVPEEQ